MLQPHVDLVRDGGQRPRAGDIDEVFPVRAAHVRRTGNIVHDAVEIRFEILVDAEIRGEVVGRAAADDADWQGKLLPHQHVDHFMQRPVAACGQYSLRRRLPDKISHLRVAETRPIGNQHGPPTLKRLDDSVQPLAKRRMARNGIINKNISFHTLFLRRFLRRLEYADFFL